MGFLDTTDAEIIALTRQRRREAQARRIAALPPPIRFTVLDGTLCRLRDRGLARIWRMQRWREGNRSCAYCGVKTVRQRGLPTSGTVDHKDPLSDGGADGPWNWAVACWLCNNRKGVLPEAVFRALLAQEKAAA